jgi:CspA family cold shock protein
MPNGTVKFFNASKKFGFVSPDDGGKDVFVPVAAAAAAGIPALRAGQRVSFETVPDGKGPKVVNLKLIHVSPSSPPETKVADAISKGEGRAQQLVFYYNPACENSLNLLAELRANGFEPREVDYIAATPNREELARLSLLLRDGSLARRSDPLFHDLRLDDRFISQNEFWDGIIEHPTLINGPIVATGTAACVCRSENIMKNFLASVFPGSVQPVVKKIIAEKIVEPATERGAAKRIVPGPKTLAAEAAQAESAAPKAGRVATKKGKATPKAIGKVSAKSAASASAKKEVRKPAPKKRGAKSK